MNGGTASVLSHHVFTSRIAVVFSGRYTSTGKRSYVVSWREAVDMGDELGDDEEKNKYSPG